MTLTRRKRVKAAAIAAVGTPIVEALGGTYVWIESGAEHWQDVIRGGRQPILALWHGRILAATLYFRDRGVVAITSQSFDGEWIARLMRRFGYSAARGSSSSGGARALVQMRRDLEAGRPVAFTVDGPLGPARVVQPGVAWLAGATRQPILPFHIEASQAWTTRSWDRHLIPKPGSTVAIAIGEPMDVSGTTDADVEAARLALGERLATLERRAHEMLGRQGERRDG